MNKIVHLSITRKDVPIRIDVVQYATIPSIVFVLDDYTPGGSATANLYIKKPDGTEIYNSCTISGNQITYNPTTQSFAALGTNICQLQIIETSGTAVSFLVYADVTENIIDSSAIESQDEFTALEDALREVESYEGRGYWWNGVLPTGTDLNNVLTMGRYYINGANTYINMPTGVIWGHLEVMRSSPGSSLVAIQRLLSDNCIYLRQSTDGGATWGPWYTFVSAESFEGRGYWWNGVLPTGTNLNTISTVGRYYINGANTYTNMPTGVTWGHLEVLRSNVGGDIIFQRLISDNRIYLRQSTGSGTWGPWHTFVSTTFMRSWTTITATFKGIAITIKYNNAIPNIVRVKMFGTASEAIATSSAFVTFGTFAQLDEPTSFFAYKQLNSTKCGQIRLTAQGDLQIGYTKRYGETTNSNIASGEGVYLDETFIVG